MRSVYRFFLATILSLCIIIVSCDNQNQPTTAINESNDAVTTDTITDDTELRNKLHPLLSEISIMKNRNGEFEGVAFFEDIKQLDQPRTFNFDTGHIQIIIRVPRTDLAQFQALQAAIQVTGDVEYTLEERDEFSGADWTRVYMDITNIRSSFSLVLGNVPILEFVQNEHKLSYDIASETLQYPYVLLGNSYNQLKIILASQEEGQMTFQFSDPIDLVNSKATSSGAASGEWIGDQQYRIKFSEEPLIQVQFDRVYTIDGAYISRELSLPYPFVHWIPERHWFSYPDNHKVGFSPRDRFYDFLLLSPSPDQYVGMIDNTAAINDGVGFNYSFYLERIDQEPYLISDGNNTTGITGLWIDDQVFLYWSNEQVTIVDTDSLEQKVLFEQSALLGQITNVNYDGSERKLMINVVIYTPGTEKYTTEIWQSTDLSTPVLSDVPSQHLEVIKNDDRHSPQIVPYKKGFLFTGIEQILPITVYVDSQKREYKASGRLFKVIGDNVILHEEKNGSEQYLIWNLLKPNKEPTAIAKAPGNVRIFGSHLIAVQLVDTHSQEKRYYKYVVSKNTWEPMTLSGDYPYMLYQGVDAIYRSE